VSFAESSYLFGLVVNHVHDNNPALDCGFYYGIAFVPDGQEQEIVAAQ
jgi:hypothetical protein